MKTCARCRRPIDSGGKWDGPLRFCGDECLSLGPAEDFLVSRAQLETAVWQVHQAPCPRCGGPGPVDLHPSWHVASVLVLTWWRREEHVACEPCGRSIRRKAAMKSLLLGWWGFPVGLVMTPVQIVRNIARNLAAVDPTRPSRELVDHVHQRLSRELIAAQVPEYEAEG